MTDPAEGEKSITFTSDPSVTIADEDALLAQLRDQLAPAAGELEIESVPLDSVDLRLLFQIAEERTFAGSKIELDFAASDPESHPLTFGLELGAPLEATIGGSSGVFTWTPLTSYNGTTNEITVYVEDASPGGTQTKRDYQTLTVIVNADSVAPQSSAGGLVADEETVTVEWNAIVGTAYQIQYKEDLSGEWIDLGEAIIASQEVEVIILENGGSARYYRITEISGAAANE